MVNALVPSVRNGLYRLEKWLGRFSKAKYKALHLRWADRLETSFAKKGPGLVWNKLDMNHHYTLEERKLTTLACMDKKGTQQFKGLYLAANVLLWATL